MHAYRHNSYTMYSTIVLLPQTTHLLALCANIYNTCTVECIDSLLTWRRCCLLLEDRLDGRGVGRGVGRGLAREAFISLDGRSMLRCQKLGLTRGEFVALNPQNRHGDIAFLGFRDMQHGIWFH